MIRAWALRVGDPGAGATLGVACDSLVSGPLALAWTGPAPAEREGVLALVDGALHDVDRLRERHRLGPDEPDEAAVALAWRREGDAALRDLRGDFGLLLWDREREAGRLIRDQLGARGVFVQTTGARLAAASEIHHLLPLLPARPSPDRSALLHWITDSMGRGPGTLFSGVRRVPPAHLIELGTPGATPVRWWSPPEPAPAARDAAAAAAAIRESAGRAVRRRLPAEAGGVLLSGGLDSGSVAALASAEGPPLHAYSATFPDHSEVDEAQLVQTVADATCSGATRLPVRTASALPAAEDYARAVQMPLFSPNFHFMRSLMQRAAGEGRAVLLDGEGGDELFGLDPYLMADRLRRGRIVSAVRLARQLPGAGDPTPWRPAMGALRKFGLIGALPPRAERAERARRARRREPVKPWLTPSGSDLLIAEQDDGGWKTRGVPRWRAHLEDVLFRVRDDIGVGQLLRLQAELSGVELRHPLLHDADLALLMLALPPELAFDASHDRPLARRALAGLLPDAVRLRQDKMLFDRFVFSCLTGPDLQPMRDLVGDPKAEINAWVDREAVRRELIDVDPARHPRGLRSWAAEMWRLATTELWLRT